MGNRETLSGKICGNEWSKYHEFPLFKNLHSLITVILTIPSATINEHIILIIKNTSDDDNGGSDNSSVDVYDGNSNGDISITIDSDSDSSGDGKFSVKYCAYSQNLNRESTAIILIPGNITVFFRMSYKNGIEKKLYIIEILSLCIVRSLFTGDIISPCLTLSFLHGMTLINN